MDGGEIAGNLRKTITQTGGGMRLLTRLLRRSLILGLGVVSVWLIVFVAFDFADQRLPWLLALSV